MVPALFSSRIVLVAGLITLALAACGRRGALEAPPSAATAAQAAAPQQGTLPSPVGTASRNRPHGFVAPNRPFLLDPLL